MGPHNRRVDWGQARLYLWRKEANMTELWAESPRLRVDWSLPAVCVCERKRVCERVGVCVCVKERVCERESVRE